MFGALYCSIFTFVQGKVMFGSRENEIKKRIVLAVV